MTGEQLAIHHHPLRKFVFTAYSTGINHTYAENGDTDTATLLAGGSQPHGHPLEGGTDQADSLPPFLSFEMVVRVA